ncbi:hypothetical protein [Burkholderia phage FLC9]|nr:hypothetical protein [Burkholderia phage FLC9]
MNQAMNPTDSKFLIKCVKSGNTGEVYYAFLNDREFWGQIDIAAKFDDLAMAITKLDSIASGEADDGVFISLREQLDTDVAALHVIRESDGTIMHANSYWGEDAKVPEGSKTSETFLLMVQRPEEDDLYINVSENAEIDVTVNIEEATRYTSMNLVRSLIQRLQEASIGELATSHETEEAAEEALANSDGWSRLKLLLVKKPVDYTEGVVMDDEGKPENPLMAHTDVRLCIYDEQRDETVETHQLRTVVMIEGAHHFAVRIIREPLQDLWINAEGGADEDFTSDESFIGTEAQVRAFMQGFEALDVNAPLPAQPADDDETEKAAYKLLKNQVTLKARLLQHDRVWMEMIDIERQMVVSSMWLNKPFYLEPVQL